MQIPISVDGFLGAIIGGVIAAIATIGIAVVIRKDEIRKSSLIHKLDTLQSIVDKIIDSQTILSDVVFSYSNTPKDSAKDFRRAFLIAATLHTKALSMTKSAAAAAVMLKEIELFEHLKGLETPAKAIMQQIEQYSKGYIEGFGPENTSFSEEEVKTRATYDTIYIKYMDYQRQTDELLFPILDAMKRINVNKNSRDIFEYMKTGAC